jgi:hypothetical protein
MPVSLGSEVSVACQWGVNGAGGLYKVSIMSL